jgi:hypothetical protein
MIPDPYEVTITEVTGQELEEAFTSGALRRVGPADELPFKDDASIYGLYELAVTW